MKARAGRRLRGNGKLEFFRDYEEGMMRQVRPRIGYIPTLLCLLAGLPLLAQEPLRGGLRIYVLQGEGAVNNIRAGLATPPVVEVRDANDFPVAGAQVTFRTPETGPSATFEGDRHEYTNNTDSKGQASAGPMKPNRLEGSFSIQVIAKAGDRSATAVIRQRNSDREYSMGGAPTTRRRSFWSRHKWLLTGMIAGSGAGLGYYFATRDTSSKAVLQPGSVVIGGPR